MTAIEGDGSPESFLAASMFARDVGELGAYWHGCGWSTHQLLFDDPLVREESLPAKCYDDPRFLGRMPDTGWRWLERRPRRWQPRVTWRKGLPHVTFFTYSGLGSDAISRHTDRFAPEGYSFLTRVRAVAEGPGGFVF